MRGLVHGAVAAVLLTVPAIAGCSGNPGTAPASKPFNGTVKNPAGKPIGNVMLHLHPLKPGFACGAEVAADGTFSSEAPPGDYAWSLRRSEKAKAADADAALKTVPMALQETDLKRTVRIAAGGTVTLVVDP